MKTGENGKREGRSGCGRDARHRDGEQHEESTSSEEGSSGSDADDEVARFEEDTQSFMLRKRDFLFPGIPAGARATAATAGTKAAGCAAAGCRSWYRVRLRLQETAVGFQEINYEDSDSGSGWHCAAGLSSLPSWLRHLCCDMPVFETAPVCDEGGDGAGGVLLQQRTRIFWGAHGPRTAGLKSQPRLCHLRSFEKMCLNHGVV